MWYLHHSDQSCPADTFLPREGGSEECSTSGNAWDPSLQWRVIPHPSWWQLFQLSFMWGETVCSVLCINMKRFLESSERRWHFQEWDYHVSGRRTGLFTQSWSPYGTPPASQQCPTVTCSSPAVLVFTEGLPRGPRTQLRHCPFSLFQAEHLPREMCDFVINHFPFVFHVRVLLIFLFLIMCMGKFCDLFLGWIWFFHKSLLTFKSPVLRHIYLDIGSFQR